MKLIERAMGRGDSARGREILDDVHELFVERRARRGRTYACMRAAWDIVALVARPRTAVCADSRPAGRSIASLWVLDAVAAWRAVRRRPLLSLCVSASLALGLGLAMLTFTVVDGILLRPLSFPRPDELLFIYSNFRPESGYSYDRFALSGPEIAEYAAQNRTVDAAAYRPEGVTLADGVNEVERIPAARVSSGVFGILETAPALGRTLTAPDDAPGAPCVAVLAHGLWRDRFHADPHVVGRIVRINGEACQVAGVMPARFAFPTETARLWLPLSYSLDPDTRGDHGLTGVGRLRPGVTRSDALEDLATLMRTWEQTLSHHKGHGVVIAPMRDELVVRVEQQLLVLAGAVVLVLFTIATNMSGLLLAHGEGRRREMAVRSALGASRASLIRQVVIEGWVLAAIGGATGGLLAWMGLDAILAAYPVPLPRAGEVQVDLRTLAAGVCVSLAIGTLVSLLPARRLTQDDPDALRTGARGGTPRVVRVQSALVTSEVAIGVAVTCGALLLVQSFIRLQQVPLGFTPDDVMTAIVGLPREAQSSGERTRQFYVDLRARLTAQPGVIAAGAISALPQASSPPPDNFTIEGRPVARPSEPGFNAGYVMMTPGFFEALRIAIVRGRGLDDRDAASAPPVAIVNETLARTYWPGSDPIGHRIRYPEGVENGEWSAWGPWITIVGVARDIRGASPARPPAPAIYVSHAQRPRSFYDGRVMGVAVRAQPGHDPALALRRIVRELEPEASVSAVRSMTAVTDAAVAHPRFMSWIMTVFAIVAVAVAALGVYGVAAHTVARRRQEIGVRLALGASRGTIARLIGRQAFAMTVCGLVLGLAGAASLAMWMRSLLFEVEPFAPAIYAGVTLILVAAVGVATLVPMRRAMGVDPLIALKTE